MANRISIPIVGWILIVWLLLAYSITVHHHGFPQGPGEGNHGSWRISWYRYHYEYMLIVPLVACAVGAMSLKAFRVNGVLIALSGVFFLLLAFWSYPAID